MVNLHVTLLYTDISATSLLKNRPKGFGNNLMAGDGAIAGMEDGFDVVGRGSTVGSLNQSINPDAGLIGNEQAERQFPMNYRGLKLCWPGQQRTHGGGGDDQESDAIDQHVAAWIFATARIGHRHRQP